MDDDSLVVTLIASKVYGDEPGVTVEVTELI
jgi:Holliday junction resolvase RusA-like endonuclease